MALFLDRAGHRVTIFERFASPRPIGSGLMLQPTGLAVLDALGLLGEISALGAPIRRLTGTDARTGRLVLNVDYAPLGPGAHAIAVHRAALFDVLHTAVVARRIPIETGFTVTGFSSHSNKSRLEAPRTRSGPFDLVVDALGATSPLKAFARFPARSRPLEFGAIWGTLPWVDDGFDRHALMQRYHRSSVMIGVLPIGRQATVGPELAAFFWSLKPDAYEDLRRAGVDSWRHQVLGHWPEAEPHLARIQSFDQMALARYAHGTLRVPAGNGIAFIGDSAHSTSPQLGQGANMALLDAAALTMALDHADTVADALEHYARLRRWHVRLYQFLSLTLTPFYQSDSMIYPIARDVLVAGAARIPLGRWLMAGMVSGQLLRPLAALALESRRLQELPA